MKSVLITGATSGIGYQLAKDYASQGWNVIACGRNASVLEELQFFSPLISTVSFDITNLDETKKALSSLPISPSLWILNAGDCEYLDDGIVDATLMSRIFSVNVVGLTNCIEATQGHYSHGDRVVIVGSIASEVALPRAEAYGASKAAVSYFARSLRLSLKPKGVDVSVVYPGFVKTPLTQKNTFDMPMLVSVEFASKQIITGISKRRSYIYFPYFFTMILRLIGLFPYSWQFYITSKLVPKKQEA